MLANELRAEGNIACLRDVYSSFINLQICIIFLYTTNMYYLSILLYILVLIYSIYIYTNLSILLTIMY